MAAVIADSVPFQPHREIKNKVDSEDMGCPVIELIFF
jgi:hypothetical protein